jgi:simple sugar transport system permease protein
VTAVVARPELRGGRAAAISGIVLGLAAALVALPPLVLKTPVVPVVLGILALVAGGAAIGAGERFLGGYAIAAALIGMAAGLWLEGAQKATLENIITAGLFAATLQYATPLVFAGLGGLISERAGVVNIGLEGMMLTGAFFGIWACDKGGSWEVGLLGAALFGGLMGLVHAVFSIHLRADQIVSGTAINIFALGITSYSFRSIYGDNGTPLVHRIPDVTIPGLGGVPGIGGVLGTVNFMVWLGLAFVVLMWVFLFKTPWGLRVRAVGEHPRAADSVGVPVYWVRYACVVASGMLAGLGGAYLSFGLLGSFNENMTAGRGFIALAAVIFGKWRPFGLLGAALLFAFAQALGDALQTSANVSADAVSILPYALTLIALVGLVGRSVPPAAAGRPYVRQ